MTVVRFVLALALSIAVHQSGRSAMIFIQAPSNATVCANDVAVFNCSSTYTIEFIINGMTITEFRANQSYSKVSVTIVIGDQNFATLYFTGAPKYNQAGVACRANSGSSTPAIASAVLRVLPPPSNLTIATPGNGTLLLNWTIPYPSSKYMVEVRNQNNSVLYNDTLTAPGLIPALGCPNYTISVAPICCAGANGASAVYTFLANLGRGNVAVFYSEIQNCTLASQDESCFDIVTFVNCAGPNYTLSIQGGTRVNGVYTPAIKGAIVFSTGLQRGREYSGQLISNDLSTFDINFSTFDIQTVTASNSSDGGLLVICTFIPGSMAKGCLILVTGSHTVRYLVIRRYGLSNTANWTLAGLIQGYYSVKAYDITYDGHLSTEGASEISGVLVTSLGTPSTPESNDIDLNATMISPSATMISPSAYGLAICMYCALKDSSAIKGCAFVLHQLYETQNVMLQTVLPRKTSCFNLSSPGNYTVAVFDWEADGIIGRGPFLTKEFQLAYVTPTSMPTGNYGLITRTNDNVAIIAGTCAGVVVLIIIISMALIALGVRHTRRRVGFAVTHDDDEKKKDVSNATMNTNVNLYEDLQGSNRVDTRIPPAVPPPRTTSDRSLNLRISSQPDESIELMTLSSRSSDITECTEISSPVSICPSDTSLCSKKTEPQYQVIPQEPNLFIPKSSSVSLQRSNSSKSQQKFNNRRNTTSHSPTYRSQSSPRIMAITAV